jgi:hypothetical protein
MDLNPEPFVDLIHDAGRPLHLNVLAQHAAQTWLEARAQQRCYAPGTQYKPGERIRFRGQWATVTNVQSACNPAQGEFSILTIRLPDGSKCFMAAGIPGAPVDEQQPVTPELMDGYLDKRGEEVRLAVQIVLDGDPRFVACSALQGELWCLRDMVPEVTEEEVRSAHEALPAELTDGEIISRTTDELTNTIWGLEDDGGDDYALCAFALRRALDACGTIVKLGDRWAQADAWRAFRADRETLTSPRQPCKVGIPEGIKKASPLDVAEEAVRETAQEEEPTEETWKPKELGDWRRDHPDHAVFTLRARHYYEGWLPLSSKVRQLFPPLDSDQQEVTFHHHFGEEPASFRAWVDRGEGRIWVSKEMYETFRDHGIYPGARLRISARNEREFDLATRETDRSEPIRVWRMWLDEDGGIEYDDFEEPRRYEIDDDVYVAAARFEDLQALFRQAEERGNSIFGLMYEQAVEWWEEREREELVVTADQLHGAIHFDEQGRMVSKASIGWELWKRLAFESLGGGRYRFRPRFGSQVRSTIPSQAFEPTGAVASPEAEAYFIFQQRPDSEYADRVGKVYNWREGIPGLRQIVEGARFIYYRPGEQVFFGVGRVSSIESYLGEDGKTYFDGHIADYDLWDPPLPLTPELAERISFVEADRLGVGQAGIRKISRDDFQSIIGARRQTVQTKREPKTAPDSRTDLWTRIAALAGQQLSTLGEGAPFKVLDVDETAVRIRVVSSDHPYSVYRTHLEAIWETLTKRGELRQTAIRQELGYTHPTYAAAILASVAQVVHQTNPIRLLYEPALTSSTEDEGKAPQDDPTSTRSEVKVTRKGPVWTWELVPPGPLFERRSADQGALERGKESETPGDGSSKGDDQSSVDVEFQQIKEVVKESLEGMYVYFAEQISFRIEDVQDDYFCVHWSLPGRGASTKSVRWQELEELYSDLRRYGRLDRTGRRKYRHTAMFGLLSRFAHIELRTEPRQELIYHEPQGPIRWRGTPPRISERVDQNSDDESQSRIDAEFEEMRAIIERSLMGETVYTLSQGKPNRILESDDEGLTVLARTESKVRWTWIKDVYEALYHLGEIESEDVQEGEFQTPGGYRGAFIFALLARFSHIEARTKPRRGLIYHQPEGRIRLEDAGDDEGDATGAPPGPPSPPPASGPSSAGPSSPSSRDSEPTSVSRRRGDMQAKTLFSQHYLQNRLPDHDEWQQDPRPVFEAVRDLWQRARRYGDTWNESQTEQEFIQPMLELLDWAYVVQPKAHHAGRVRRPDYALFPDETAKDDAMPHQGDDAAFYSRAPAIAEAKYWGRPLSQQDPSGRETWDAQSNPSHQMVSYLVGTRVSWGILTNGRTWRLYSREVSSTASEYYEIDLGLIFDILPEEGEPSAEQAAELMDQFRRFWLFFRQQSFEADARGRSFVDRVHEGSDTYARRISDTLKRLVYDEVMPEIAGGFVAYRYHQKGVEEETEQSLRRIYRASLSLLYKLLFLLYGEARALLPVSNPVYREQSLTAMARWAAERLDQDLPLSDATYATNRYDTLLALFHRIDRGDPSLGIPRYDGGLFDPSSPENQFLEEHKLSDGAVARTIDTLVRDAGEPVDYAYIGVQNLGSIYEGLLENRLRVVDAAAGEVELIGDKGERKATGSYYTPDYIVEYIVQHTLDPILTERDGDFRAAMDRCADLRHRLRRTSDTTTIRRLRDELDDAERDAREAFLGIRVVDPAMGSGHFLVNAVDHLTDAVIRRIQVYHDEHPDVPWDWNPIQRLIDRVRGAILAEMERQGIQVDPARLDDTALLTRLVMKRCIYGVDLNRMAVELAKVSLWLHTFTVGAPLSFLDHHLRWGNSLIGTDVRTVEEKIQRTGAGQLSLWQGPFAGLLDLTGLMVEVVERADATLADVRQSADRFKQFQKELTPYKRVLDLWVSQHFANEDAYEFMTLYGDDVLPAVRGKLDIAEQYRAAIERAHALYQDKRFFHWDLEFPEVFVDLRARDWADNPGFDAVIGNPPYIRSVLLKEIDPVAWAYYGLSYRVAAKREFDIYLCFAERGLELLSRQGHFGMILPNKWFTTRVGASLRELLAEQWAVERIVDFGYFQVFCEVTTYTCLLFLKGSACRNVFVATLVEAPEEAQPLPETQGQWQTGTISLRDLDAAAWNFVLGPAGPLLDRLDGYPHLGEVATVFKGTGTSADAVFFMEHQGDRFYSRSLEQWVEIEGELMRPSLTGQDIDPYYYNPDNYLLFPYRIVGEDARLIPADEMAAEYPKAWAYLNRSHNRGLLENRDKGAFRSRDDWYAFGRPQNMHLLAREKLVGPDVAGQAEFTCDREGRYIIDTVYAVRTDEDVRPSLLTLTAILNNPLMTFFLQQTGTDLRGGYFRMKTAYLNPFPIPRISFTTSPEKRERLAVVGIAEAAEWTESAQGASAESAGFSVFSDSSLGRWLDERLSPIHTPDPDLVREHNAHPLNEDCQLPEEGPVEQSDVVHDLLAHLAEEMIDLHKDRQRLEEALDPFKYLDRGVAFVPLAQAFEDAIKYGDRVAEPVDLGAVHHDIDGLRLVQIGDQWELQVQLKKRDPEADWQEWQYEEGGNYIAREWVPAYRFPLSDAKARYYQHALEVRDDCAEAKSFPGGYTRSTEKKLRLSGVPAFDEDADLEPLVDLSEDLAAVQARIAATDRLIDLIVYRLYGLTEEEVAIVEGKSA